MNHIPRRSLLCVLTACAFLPIPSKGQQPTPASADSNLPPANWVKLYSRDQVIAGPAIIEPEISIESDCKGKKSEGKVTLSFVVDSDGQPRNVFFEIANGNNIDLLALKWMLNSRFKPARFQDTPVPMGQKVEMRLQACQEETKDTSGKNSATFRLRLPPEEKFEDWQHSPAQANLAPIDMPSDVQAEHRPANGNFTPPKVLVRPSPPSANGHSGSFSFLVRVDEHGILEIQQTITSTDPQLLPGVMQCIRNFRHVPAFNNGMPVPAQATVGLSIKSGP